MGQGRGRRLCGADRVFARWESTHGVCTESRGFRGRRASDEGESAFDGERPGSRVPFSAHAVRFAPRNRAAEAPGSRGFRRGRVLCLGWREVPSGGDGCALVRGSAFDEVRPGSGYLPRLMLSAYASRNRLWRHPLPGRSGEQVVVPWLVRNAFRRRWLHLAWKKCLRWGGAPRAGCLPRLMLSAALPEIACGGTRLLGLSEGGGCPGQRNTTVLWPFSMMRCSACHLTARASTTFSTSPPRAVRVSTVMVWSTRSTSCSMMGPSSSSAVT